MADSTFKLPWLIPGFQRPNFKFYKIKMAIPTEIPQNLIFLVIYLSILYIFIGGVYNLVNEDTIAFGTASDGGPELFYPGQDRQFLIEGIVAGVIMFVGAAGLYLLNQATTDPHNVNRAATYQIIGGLLVMLSYFVLANMFRCKINPSEC